MARPNKEALENARRISGMSDEEIGRWLASLVDTALSTAIDNALLRIAVRVKLTDDYLDNVTRFDSVGPSSLAAHLALRGEYEKAGATLRRCPTMLRVLSARSQDRGRRKGRETSAERKSRKTSEYLRVGLAIRNKESGAPMYDTSLAKEIERKCARTVGGKFGSIRVRLKSLGLDRKTWLARKPVNRPRSKLRGKKLRTSGSLRRSFARAF